MNDPESIFNVNALQVGTLTQFLGKDICQNNDISYLGSCNQTESDNQEEYLQPKAE